MRKAGRILAETLTQLVGFAQEGIAFIDLDELARGIIQKAGGKPAFLGYAPEGAKRPFGATLCTSLNHVVVHGVPTSRRLQSGDLLKLDLGVNFEGFYADAALTIGIGNISRQASELIQVTQKALEAGIQGARPGNTLGDIGFAVSKTAAEHGFKVIKGLTGHGIGQKLHEDPVVLNEGQPGKGLILQSGMTLAIEPMLSAGSNKVIQLDDDSYATSDGSLSAHFEHTIVVTEKGAEVLTVI